MMTDNVETRVHSVLAQIFHVPNEAIRPDLRRGDLETWDSIGHLSLVEALRLEFSIDISPESALDMETVNDVVRIVGDIQAQRAGA